MSPVYVYGYGRRKHIKDEHNRAPYWEVALCGASGDPDVRVADGWTREQVEAAWPTCKHCQRKWDKRTEAVS